MKLVLCSIVKEFDLRSFDCVRLAFFLLFFFLGGGGGGGEFDYVQFSNV